MKEKAAVGDPAHTDGWPSQAPCHCSLLAKFLAQVCPLITLYTMCRVVNSYTGYITPHTRWCRPRRRCAAGGAGKRLKIAVKCLFSLETTSIRSRAALMPHTPFTSLWCSFKLSRTKFEPIERFSPDHHHMHREIPFPTTVFHEKKG